MESIILYFFTYVDNNKNFKYEYITNVCQGKNINTFFLLISSFCFLFVFIIIIIIIIIIIHFCCNSEPTHRRLEFFPLIRNYDIL